MVEMRALVKEDLGLENLTKVKVQQLTPMQKRKGCCSARSC